MFIRGFMGAKRASILSTSRPIDTPEELRLYTQLLPLHTTGVTTNWDFMARDFNDVVCKQVKQNPVVGSQKPPLRIKTARQLAQFDRIVSQELCRREASGMMEALAGIPPQPPTVSMGAQQVVDGIAALMRARPAGASCRRTRWAAGNACNG